MFLLCLIHEHELNRHTIWNTNLNINVAKMQNIFVFHYILSITIIFVTCIFIEKIRKILFSAFFKIPVFNEMKHKVNKKYETINKRINNFLKA